VNSPDEVTEAVRSNLRGGADFIKIMAGGGVASTYDKLEYNGASVSEMESAVEAATDFGTYVAIHGYHDTSYDRALNAGVRSFEHGFLVSEDIVKRMAEKDEDVVWSFQCFMSVTSFGDYDKMPEFFSHEQKLKGLSVGEGALNVAKMMKEHGVFIIGGSDMFGPEFTPRIKEDITCNVDAGFTPAEALRHWTGNAGKVLKWSGPFDPYTSGKLGIIEEEAYADILLWNGDPTQDISLILDEDNLTLIMKDGVIYKNSL
jgi:imidazolonepropionase-like amidohydrolase